MSTHTRSKPHRRAFTLLELLAAAAAGSVLLACVAVCIGEPGGESNDLETARGKARQIKDATQLRAIHQGMVLWAQNNADKYPLPSLVDKDDATISDRGTRKDTTGHIMSLMVYAGFFSPELLVSPVENNPRVGVMGTYEFSAPKAAVNAEKALWDPALSADFTRREGGHVSYAHLQPFGGRLERWSSTYQVDQPIVSNRGPEIGEVAYGEDNDKVTMLLKSPRSLTMKAYGPSETWRGNVAYADNHVDFVTSKIGDGATGTNKDLGKYKFAGDRTRPDILFLDESEDPKTLNNYLGIFTKASEARGEWKGIWD